MNETRKLTIEEKGQYFNTLLYWTYASVASLVTLGPHLAHMKKGMEICIALETKGNLAKLGLLLIGSYFGFPFSAYNR